MRIGILGQPCIDEIIAPDGAVRKRSLGGILYSYAAMERLLGASGQESDTFVPLSFLSEPDRSLLDPLLTQFRHLDRVTGLWPTSELTNRVQLVYSNASDRTEHCPTILPGLSEQLLAPGLMSSLDGLFVNMISGYDVSLSTLEEALYRAAQRPLIHLDIHALILGSLSKTGDSEGFGEGRAPAPVTNWQRWLAIADTVQLNELELRWLAAPEITADAELVHWLRSNRSEHLRYLIITRAARGATLYDLAHEAEYHAAAPAVSVVEPTGSGDVFGAVFHFTYLTTGDPQLALKRAVQYASWNATLSSIGAILTAPLPVAL